MLQLVESRVYAALPAVRTQGSIPARVNADTLDSAERNVQAFVDSLPQNVRERIGQKPRGYQERPDLSGDTQQAEASKSSSDPISEAAAARSYFSINQPQGFYSAPVFTPGLALLQAQFSNDYAVSNTPVNATQREAANSAYLSAGAQPGGRTSALEASLRQAEVAKRVQVVPPVLTSLNFVA